ncbi:signal peptidase I [bacterium]|nr:signal peptidase I [bacterium]
MSFEIVEQAQDGSLDEGANLPDSAVETVTPAVEHEAVQQKAILRDYIETILVCVIFVIFSRAFVFQQSKIPSGSMEDTLLIGDYIMVNRFVYAPTQFEWERKLLPNREIKRGDVIVFKQPQEPEQDYIKRIAGVPGDTVEVRNGFLYVNDELVDEPWVRDDYRIRASAQRRRVIDDDHYFMLGDHRNGSSDSRSWGLVHRDLIKGRALLIWYSFDEERHASPYPKTGERLAAWGYKIRHFRNRTRWGRCFSLIR